jgi:nucleotide-binding universal stress UspA family protein
LLLATCGNGFVIAKILCALTLSDISRRTFEHALAVGKCCGASIIALHVFAGWLPPRSLGTYPGWFRHVPAARAQIDQELEDLLQPAVDAGGRVTLTVREGEPAREILKAAEILEADLIVLGAPEPRRADRFVRESIAGIVVRTAMCPVLVIARQDATSPPLTRYRSIVHPTDFSEDARAALDYAILIAAEAEASLTAVHVIETNTGRLESGHDRSSDMSTSSALETPHRNFCTVIKRGREHQCEIEGIVRAGVVSREIVRLVGERAGDLVVMGVRGVQTIGSRRIGFTTTQILRDAPCAVLTVRRNTYNEDHPA